MTTLPDVEPGCLDQPPGAPIRPTLLLPATTPVGVLPILDAIARDRTARGKRGALAVDRPPRHWVEVIGAVAAGILAGQRLDQPDSYLREDLVMLGALAISAVEAFDRADAAAVARVRP